LTTEQGSDATHVATHAVPETRNGVEGWRINSGKKWQSGMHVATHCFIFARTSGKDGDTRGITCLIVPPTTPGFKIRSYEWTLNMPTDHTTLTDVWVPSSQILGPVHNGHRAA